MFWITGPNLFQPRCCAQCGVMLPLKKKYVERRSFLTLYMFYKHKYDVIYSKKGLRYRNGVAVHIRRWHDPLKFLSVRNNTSVDKKKKKKEISFVVYVLCVFCDAPKLTRDGRKRSLCKVKNKTVFAVDLQFRCIVKDSNFSSNLIFQYEHPLETVILWSPLKSYSPKYLAVYAHRSWN